jgi:hypothetical protein
MAQRNSSKAKSILKRKSPDFGIQNQISNDFSNFFKKRESLIRAQISTGR